MPSYLSVLESILFCAKPKRKVWPYDQLMDEIATRHSNMKNRRSRNKVGFGTRVSGQLDGIWRAGLKAIHFG